MVVMIMVFVRCIIDRVVTFFVPAIFLPITSPLAADHRARVIQCVEQNSKKVIYARQDRSIDTKITLIGLQWSVSFYKTRGMKSKSIPMERRRTEV